MINNDQLDDNIKQVLSTELVKIEAPDDMYLRIEENIKGKKGRPIPGYAKNITRTVLAFSLSLAVILGVSAIFSPTVRAIALDTIDAIKTIFVVEGTGDDYKVVEKDASESEMVSSVSSTTSLSDEALSKLLGYKVSFPQKLYGEFALKDKALTLSLGKEMDYITAQSLQASMLKAINDSSEFEKLKDYDPRLSVFATYVSDTGNTIFTSIDKLTDTHTSSNNGSSVKIGEYTGIWQEFAFPDYPTKVVDGIKTADLTQKPKGVIKLHAISWNTIDLHYSINSYAYQKYELTKENAIKIAESFLGLAK
ncbi:MAG: hypothetical protein N3I35_05370 [Clostridia bacterium]|nr:hypothetical protein [Clostridia bacterium]